MTGDLIYLIEAYYKRLKTNTADADILVSKNPKLAAWILTPADDEPCAIAPTKAHMPFYPSGGAHFQCLACLRALAAPDVLAAASDENPWLDAVMANIQGYEMCEPPELCS